MTRRYFRIQPAGLGLDHRSETSSGEVADGLHVFVYLHQALRPDGSNPNRYGNEVVIVEAETDWTNGDVEGVCVDGAAARLVARYSLPHFAALAAAVDKDSDADEFCQAVGLG